MKLCPKCRNGLPGVPDRCSVCDADLSGVDKVGEDGLAGMTVADGRYELTELLGEGGMAWVYRGIHKALGREVAIKLLKSAPVALAAEQSQRFEREARMASQLNHPHVVSIIDFGRTQAGLMFLITEYINGRPLHEVLWEDRPLTMARIVDIFHQVLAAIDEAHSAGVIHRDIKPENIIVNQLRSGEDFVKVLDFGIAVLAGRPDGKVTQAGAFIGTPGFMSPEQILGEEATERSDIYALGVMLYEMLAGKAAFENDSPVGVMTMQLDGDIASLAEVVPERELPSELDEVVATAIATEPENRYASVAELRDALLDATSRMSRVHLDCSSCSRPVDPLTGLCRLHRGSGSAQRSPQALEAVRTEALPKVESIEVRSRAESPSRVGPEQLAAEGVVGRDEAYARTAEFLEGEQTTLVVSGADGLGKTTLARAIERVGAEDLGTQVIRTGADPLSATTPWFPVRELVGRVLGCGPSPKSPREYVETTGGMAFSDADAVGLHLLFGFEDEHAPRKGPARRNAINTAASRVLIAGGGRRGGPWLIAEDAHRYDHASLDFIRGLGALASGTSLKLVVTAERDPGGWAGPHQALPLDRLPPESVAKLVEHLFDGANAEVLEGVIRAVGETGIPAHAVEAQRLFADGGDPCGTLEDVLVRMLDRLTPVARRALQTVSLIGSRVSPDVVRSVGDGEQVDAALELLAGRGLVTIDSLGVVSPASPLVARAAVDSLAPNLRREIGEALLSVMTDNGGSVFVLARLADEAGQTERAVELLERAGDEAVRLEDAAGAALVYYRRASHLVRWELLMSEEDEAYLRIALKMGQALSISGHRKSAEVVYKEIIAAAGRHPAIGEKAKQGLGTLTAN